MSVDSPRTHKVKQIGGKSPNSTPAPEAMSVESSNSAATAEGAAADRNIPAINNSQTNSDLVGPLDTAFNAHGWRRVGKEIMEDKVGFTRKISHVKTVNEITQNIPETSFPQDKSFIKAKIPNSFEILTRSRQHFAKNQIRPMPLDPITINCFTDGSKNEEGSGAGYIIKSYYFETQESIYLGENATVFQAEIMAISTASLSMLDAEIRNKVIQFYIDSQSAIKALDSYIVYNKSVAECKRLLNKLSEYENDIILNWIPGHSNQRGNGIADNLAKRGASHPEPGIEPRIPVSGRVIRNAIKKWGKSEQQRLWTERTDCRQSKLVLPTVNHEWGSILNYDRRHLRVLTQLVTGHANLKRHRSLMGMEDNANCDHCGEPQEAIHLLTECPGLVGERITILGKPIITHDEVRTYRISRLIKFAKSTGYWNLE